MKFFSGLILFLAAEASRSQVSYVPPARILGEKGYQLGVSADYFRTIEQVDTDGNRSKFPEGETFSRLDADVFGQYGLAENFQMGGGIRLRQNFFNFAEDGEDEETQSSSGLESTFVNAAYAFKPVGQFQYTLEGLFRWRPFRNDEPEFRDEGNLVLGDDGNEFAGGLAVTYFSKRKRNFLSGRFGYRDPARDLSPELYWQLEGAVTWPYVGLVVGVNGVSSLDNDPYENEPQDRPTYNTGNTALYGSINREWIAPYLGVNVGLGNFWRLEFRGSQVTSGRSMDLGTGFGVALVKRVDLYNRDLPDRAFKDYDFEGAVTRVSPKKGYVVIDKGLADDVQKGMKIDFFEFDYVGGNILLARGIVLQSKAETAIVKITHHYNTKKTLKEGVVARGTFR
jgi:hypothetical protein